MKTVKGDILQLALNGEFDVIVHGCNCFNTFGAGIAFQIKKLFPEAYANDCKTIKGDRTKLGTIISTNIVREDISFILVNAYTQYSFTRVDVPIAVDYDAIRKCFKTIRILFNDKRIAYPAIGAGLAGGDWQIISKIIGQELVDCNHTFVEYNKNNE